jgi:hypothetical protein
MSRSSQQSVKDNQEAGGEAALYPSQPGEEEDWWNRQNNGAGAVIVFIFLQSPAR